MPGSFCRTRSSRLNLSTKAIAPFMRACSEGTSALNELLVIMIIEDDPAVQSIVEEALTEGGFEPAIAASGEEAVTLLQGNRGKYRALVTDIDLHGRTNGWELAKRARQIDPEFPVVYMTGA